QRLGNGHPNIVPYSVFPTQDGHVILAVGNDSQFRAFCGAMDRNDLAQDARFVTNPLRISHRDTLEAIVIETFATKPSALILSMLQHAGVPCGPIHTIEQALTSDQALARGAVVQLDDPEACAGQVSLLGNPLKLSKTPVKYGKAPPRFGADTADLTEILSRHAAARNTAD
ncbi:MAG: CoA transferase, partial [Octadecabacter sp.]